VPYSYDERSRRGRLISGLMVGWRSEDWGRSVGGLFHSECLLMALTRSAGCVEQCPKLSSKAESMCSCWVLLGLTQCRHGAMSQLARSAFLITRICDAAAMMEKNSKPTSAPCTLEGAYIESTQMSDRTAMANATIPQSPTAFDAPHVGWPSNPHCMAIWSVLIRGPK